MLWYVSSFTWNPGPFNIITDELFIKEHGLETLALEYVLYEVQFGLRTQHMYYYTVVM